MLLNASRPKTCLTNEGFYSYFGVRTSGILQSRWFKKTTLTPLQSTCSKLADQSLHFLLSWIRRLDESMSDCWRRPKIDGCQHSEKKKKVQLKHSNPI